MAYYQEFSGRQSADHDVPSLEPTCGDIQTDLLLRLRSQNQALEKLRDALDFDDEAGPGKAVAVMAHG